MAEPAPERTPPDDTTGGLRRRVTEAIEAGWAPDDGFAVENAADAAMAVVAPVLERYRKAVEDAPRGAIWTGACAECGTAIQPGDAITWRLRWSPQGPIHEECR